MPIDAEVVVALDIPKIAQSALWKEYAPMVMGRLPETAKMLIDQCALTPTTIAKTAQIARQVPLGAPVR